MKKNVLIISISALLVVAIAVVFIIVKSQNKNTGDNVVKTDNTPTKKGNVLFMKDWNFYTNEALDFKIQHPKNMDPIEYLNGTTSKVVNFKYKDSPSSSYSLTVIDNKDKKFENDKYRTIYSDNSSFNIIKETVNVDDVVGTRYIIDDNAATAENRADDIIFEKNGKTYIISAAIKDANFSDFFRTFDFIK